MQQSQVNIADGGAAGSQLLTVQQACSIMQDSVAPVADIGQATLVEALGRVLARDVVSPIDVPAHDNSAMDGYALRGAELAAGIGTGRTVVFAVAGVALAGAAYVGSVPAGACVRIMTGAPIPADCDTVVPQELVRVEAGGMVAMAGDAVAPGANCRRRGEDLAVGSVALRAGRLLRPADLGLAASLGLAGLPVRRRLRVAFFTSGDELRAPGQPLDHGSIYDSNRYTLHGMLSRLGCEIIDLGRVGDDPVALEAVLRSACAANADAVISCGGVSVGEADHTRAAMARLGEMKFWQIAMRPGRPLAFGRIADAGRTAWLFGLPGNPVAAMVAFYFLARPALLRMMGASAGTLPLLQAVALENLRKASGRTEFQRGILVRGGDGNLGVRATGSQGSGILSSMTQADCMIVLEHGRGTVQAGETIDVLPFEGLV